MRRSKARGERLLEKLGCALLVLPQTKLKTEKWTHLIRASTHRSKSTTNGCSPPLNHDASGMVICIFLILVFVFEAITDGASRGARAPGPSPDRAPARARARTAPRPCRPTRSPGRPG